MKLYIILKSTVYGAQYERVAYAFREDAIRASKELVENNPNTSTIVKATIVQEVKPEDTEIYQTNKGLLAIVRFPGSNELSFLVN